jgi:hypothetical protein
MFFNLGHKRSKACLKINKNPIVRTQNSKYSAMYCEMENSHGETMQRRQLKMKSLAVSKCGSSRSVVNATCEA